MASAGLYASLHLIADNHANIPPLSFFTGRMPYLPPNQQCQSTEGTYAHNTIFQTYKSKNKFRNTKKGLSHLTKLSKCTLGSAMKQHIYYNKITLKRHLLHHTTHWNLPYFLTLRVLIIYKTVHQTCPSSIHPRRFLVVSDESIYSGTHCIIHVTKLAQWVYQ